MKDQSRNIVIKASKSFNAMKGGNMSGTNFSSGSTLRLAPGPDYNQESAKKWVLLRSVSGKDFSCPQNVLGQFLLRTELRRDDFARCTSIYEINKINIDAFEGLWTVEISAKHQKVAERQHTRWHALILVNCGAFSVSLLSGTPIVLQRLCHA
jgi:hypothetical protein